MTLKMTMKTFFTKIFITKSKKPPVQAKKKLHSYNDDANKIIKQIHKKKAIKHLNFLIKLVMMENNTNQKLKSPKHSTKPGIIPMKILAKNGKKPFIKSLSI